MAYKAEKYLSTFYTKYILTPNTGDTGKWGVALERAFKYLNACFHYFKSQFFVFVFF